ARILIRHQSFRGGQNCHANAVLDSWNTFDSYVNAAARLAHPLHTGHHRLPFRYIAQLHFQYRVSILDLSLNALNIPFVLENAKDLSLETGGRNADDIVAPPKS